MRERFLAVDLSAEVRTQVGELIDRHRLGRPDAKWLSPHKLHCTLVFLGEPTAAQVEQWVSPLTALARTHRPFELRLQAAGTFATQRAPSVLWLGVGGELSALAALQNEARSALGGEERAFVPHVTLARARRGTSLDELCSELAEFSSPAFQVEHITLFESTSETYRVLQRAPLGAR